MHYPHWLKDFFQFNEINLEKISKQDYPEPKRSILNDFLKPLQQQHAYIALPYYAGVGTPVRIFVAGAHDIRALIELEMILKCALGSSYIAHYELISELKEHDAATTVLLGQFPIGLVCLSFYTQTSRDDILNGFRLCIDSIQILNRRPLSTQVMKRPVGRILREFHLAKEVGDVDTVMRCFEEIKTNSSLAARNLIFLEIQSLAIAQRWAEIRQHPQLQHLIESVMPSYLLQNILDALGQTGGDQLFAFPLTEQIDIQALQEEYQKFKPIFTRYLELPKDPKYKRQWKQWLIGSALLGQHQFLEQLPRFIDMHWCGDLVQMINDRGCFIQTHEGKHSGLHLTIPQSIEQTRIYLNYCVNLAPEKWFEIWYYLEKIPLEIRAYLNNNLSLKQKWDRVEAYCSSTLVYEWNHWFEELQQDQALDAEQLLFKLHNEYPMWTTRSFSEPQLSILLHRSKGEVEEILRDALPILLHWLVENQVNLSSETVLMLFALLVDEEKNDPNDLQLFHEILSYWTAIRENHHDDHRVETYLECLLKKCQQNPLYNLPIYQDRVKQIVALLNDEQQD